MVKAGLLGRLSLTDVARAATQEGMQAGYDIVLPVDEKNDKGELVCSSYQLANPWPGAAQRRADGLPRPVQRQEAGTERHELERHDRPGHRVRRAHPHGHPVGLLDRIVMTTGTLLLLVSIGTSLVMWWLRRPQGRAGLPKRPANPRLP